jgi:hypothetical protein
VKSENSGNRFAFAARTSSEPLTENENDELIDILTDMMVARYIAEHPDQFERQVKQREIENGDHNSDGTKEVFIPALTQDGGSIIIRGNQLGGHNE